ncbi:hypothetical protein [Bradyrhizobium sp. B117]|uniref:hypothetical protein n=1 Tax=Bradyrhizobium sp. B117 TaxID=3140246 RepID=UPI0031836764
MSRGLCCPFFGPAISSCCITPAATEAKRFAGLIRSIGAKFFLLPKHSPGLNPSEQIFAMLEHLLRKAARTVDAVCAAIGKSLDTFTPEKCANCLQKI